jgi:hypothetical protein
MRWGERLYQSITRLGWSSLLLLGVPLLALLAILFLGTLGD